MFFPTQMDYTGVEQNSPCFKCSDPDVKNCVCQLKFTINSLFKVALELCTLTRIRTHTNSTFLMKLNCTPASDPWLCFVFFRGPCSFIMVCPTTSRTTESMVCLKMLTSCLETWTTLRWVNNIGYWWGGKHTYNTLVLVSQEKQNSCVLNWNKKTLKMLRYKQRVKTRFIWVEHCFLSLLQSPSETCAPYRDAGGKPIVPCGAIANSMFNGIYILK